MRTTILVAVATAALTVGGTAQAASDFPVQAAYDAITAGDIETAVSYLTEDSVYVVIPAPRPWGTAAKVGPEEIGGWWGVIHKDNARVEVENVSIDGDRATWTAKYYSTRMNELGLEPATFDCVGIIRDGKIRTMTWTHSREFEDRIRAMRSN